MRFILIGVLIALPVGLIYEYVLEGPYPGPFAAAVALLAAFALAGTSDARRRTGSGYYLHDDSCPLAQPARSDQGYPQVDPFHVFDSTPPEGVKLAEGEIPAPPPGHFLSDEARFRLRLIGVDPDAYEEIAQSIAEAYADHERSTDDER